MAIDPQTFRQALGSFASGVTVVTTTDGARPHGLTVSSFSSLSLDPPLILICIGKESRGHDTILRSGRFAVNILAADQEWISRHFASAEDDKFAGVSWHPGDFALPLIDSAVAQITCTLHASLPGGDHTILVGEVVAAHVSPAQPLLYFRRNYHTLAG